jgi:hypothetical protein
MPVADSERSSSVRRPKSKVIVRGIKGSEFETQQSRRRPDGSLPVCGSMMPGSASGDSSCEFRTRRSNGQPERCRSLTWRSQVWRALNPLSREPPIAANPRGPEIETLRVGFGQPGNRRFAAAGLRNHWRDSEKPGSARIREVRGRCAAAIAPVTPPRAPPQGLAVPRQTTKLCGRGFRFCGRRVRTRISSFRGARHAVAASPQSESRHRIPAQHNALPGLEPETGREPAPGGARCAATNSARSPDSDRRAAQSARRTAGLQRPGPVPRRLRPGSWRFRADLKHRAARAGPVPPLLPGCGPALGRSARNAARARPGVVSKPESDPSLRAAAVRVTPPRRPPADRPGTPGGPGSTPAPLQNPAKTRRAPQPRCQ